jgi:hypothetical protein
MQRAPVFQFQTFGRHTLTVVFRLVRGEGETSAEAAGLTLAGLRAMTVLSHSHRSAIVPPSHRWTCTTNAVV